MIKLLECQVCEGIYFKTTKSYANHLECYHKELFNLLPKDFITKFDLEGVN